MGEKYPEFATMDYFIPHTVISFIDKIKIFISAVGADGLHILHTN